MQIMIIRNSRKKKYDVDSRRFGDILVEIGLNSEEFLGIKNGSLIIEDELIKEGDTIKLLDVVSGG